MNETPLLSLLAYSTSNFLLLDPKSTVPVCAGSIPVVLVSPNVISLPLTEAFDKRIPVLETICPVLIEHNKKIIRIGFRIYIK